MGIPVEGVEGFKRLAGKHVGKSDWHAIDQGLIDLFAKATGDFNWIHVDPVTAARDSPFGSTITHGYHPLSLIPMLFIEVLEFRNVPMGLNYGMNKVRFPAPVKVNQRVRLDLSIIEVKDAGEAVDVISNCIVEIEGNDKPACVAETIYRFFPRRELKKS